MNIILFSSSVQHLNRVCSVSIFATHQPSKCLLCPEDGSIHHCKQYKMRNCSDMSSTTFSWETLPVYVDAIYVDVTLTCTIYINIIADQVHLFMAPCRTAKTAEECFEEYDLQLPQISVQSSVFGMCWKINSDSQWPYIAIRRTASAALVQDTTVYLQRLWSPCLSGSELF